MRSTATLTAAGANRLWVADAARIPGGEGMLWLATVRDVFSRQTVGLKTSERGDTDLILAALENAIWSRNLRDGQLVHHSDRARTIRVSAFATLAGQRSPAVHGLGRRLVRQRVDEELLVNAQD
ncbi:DDE-type integrase/transposase/recombinase [Paractinoplanes pyxinae]|uniref:DDE-type integrase/transposase/recombinase n=1 Tax=Paractinoplanes pyxinae TaxID=2997416 RepID=UPI0034DB7400